MARAESIASFTAASSRMLGRSLPERTATAIPEAAKSLQLPGIMWPSASSLPITGNAVLNHDYNYVQPYTLFPYGSQTYNSNSFVNTLNVNFNLGFQRPPGSPGWSSIIPNLGP